MATINKRAGVSKIFNPYIHLTMQSNPTSSSNATSSFHVSLSDDSWIPEGYVLVVGPNNKNYIVPDFILPALKQDYLAAARKEEIMAFSAPGTVSCIFSIIHAMYRHATYRHATYRHVTYRHVRYRLATHRHAFRHLLGPRVIIHCSYVYY